MHVAQVISTQLPPEEGIGYYVYNLSQQLLDHGHRVTVLTRGGLTTERLKYDGIEILRLPFVPAYPVHVDVHGKFVDRALASMEEDLDVVHLHSPLPPAVDTPLPTVATVHTSVVEDAKEMQEGRLGEVYYKLLARVTSRRIIQRQCDAADRVTTVAHSVADELDEYYGVDDALVFGNAVDIDEFDADAPAADGDYVLYVGRFHHRKGIADLLDAAAEVLDAHDVEFRFVGKGPLEGKMHDRAADLGIADRTEFLGHVDRERLVALFRGATVFALPSHYEGLPTTMLEAMAAGAPVVATRVSGVPDVVDDGENGLLVPSREPSRLADGIGRLLADPDLRDRLSTAGRRTIIDNYTWDSIGAEFEALYRDLLPEADAPAATQ